ncbi:unnamed protein product [Colias eurytheme]|nr:unnamed protein product [Colias eurytheme]
MSPKILIICGIFLFLATLVESNGNLVEGTPYGGERIYHKMHTKIAIPFIKRDDVIQVNAPGSSLIKAVVVQDLYGNGECYIVGGGVGQRSVSIKLKSPRFKGYSFLVDVYAM